MQIDLHTPIEDYLRACEARGANADGDCPSFAWARGTFSPDTPLGEALTALEENDRAQEAAMFAFDKMLDDLDTFSRRRFGKVISLTCGHVVQAWAWRKMLDAGIEATGVEDWQLRSQWHSSWVGKSALPGWGA